MKAFWISLALFLLVIGAVIANAAYISYISDRLEEYSKSIQYNKSPADLIEELQDFWDKHRKFIGLSMETPEIDSVEKTILSLKLSYEEGQEFEFERCRLLLAKASREIKRLETFSIENIF